MSDPVLIVTTRVVAFVFAPMISPLTEVLQYTEYAVMIPFFGMGGVQVAIIRFGK